MPFNIYLLTQDVVSGYDTYDSLVVVAESEEKARLIRPDYNSWEDGRYYSWPSNPTDVRVKLLGTSITNEEEVILSSFHAG